jgi:hypothetical protein
MLQFNALTPGSFRVTGGKKSVLIFPSTAPKPTDAEIVVLAGPEENPTKGVVSWPGEYNTGGISIKGIGHEEGRQVSYVMEVEGVRVGVLSSPLKEWTDKQLESVPDIDVLAIPGDDAKLAQKLIDEFDPRVLLLLPGKDLATLEKAVGVKEHLAEYKLKGSLPVEGRESYVLGA